MKNPANTTVIYITSNIGDEVFEKNIRKYLRSHCADLPIVSVSRKPIKLGKNICVGEETPLSESTYQKQILKGLMAAKTEFALIAKSDCLYPPEYFSFIPPLTDSVYYYDNSWLLGDKFWKKNLPEDGFICNRKLWIELLRLALKGQRGWQQVYVPPIFYNSPKSTWTSDNPIICFKTTTGSQRFSTVSRTVFPKRELALWGNASDLKTKFGL
jgi:hypothetical protein